MDEVLFQLLPEWIRRYNLLFDDDLDYRTIDNWDATKFVKSEAKHRIYDILDDRRMFADLEPVDGAYEAMQYLLDNHDVTICSHALTTNILLGKLDALEKHFGIGLEYCIFTKDKHLVRGDILIDDNLKNCMGTSANAIIFSRPWNEKIVNLGSMVRANSWEKTIELVKELAMRQ